MTLKHRGQAYVELLRRYKTIFVHHWQHRHALSALDLSEHEAEFLPAALSLQTKPVSPASRLLARVLMLLVVALVTWSVIGKIDIVVTATGKVIPSGYTKTIASVDVASVRALYVQEGQQVKAGDVLIELDTSATDAERDKAQGDTLAALLQAARAQALISAIDTGRPPHLAAMPQISQDLWRAENKHLEGQYRDYQAKLQRLDGDITRYSQALPLATQVASDYKGLLADHDVSYHAWLEKEQARVDLAGQLADARNQRTALIEETRRTAYDQLTDGSKAAASSTQDALRSDAHSKLLKLTAPVNGTVQQLEVHTVGGVVAAATPLMQIVPQSTQVEVEAFMDNKDVGFAQEGQNAEVKVDAFEYTKYGTLKGHVVHVSRDAIKDDKKGWIYSTKIALDQSSINVDGKNMLLSAGMTTNVEIKTGDRRIIEYVLSPLIRHQRESFNER
ncbi:HlyD family type I secretion periplasmic adaptor subunit [Rhodoferax sp. GW822-FHT02A01]|uniref:HlyD family type I secretion periplasmic adaptor subunit n=1 Tax=Rhodoferax sp. GW822-FHT02A01 TaxID=3141537 RepID=UPI00315D8E33